MSVLIPAPLRNRGPHMRFALGPARPAEHGTNTAVIAATPCRHRFRASSSWQLTTPAPAQPRLTNTSHRRHEGRVRPMPRAQGMFTHSLPSRSRAQALPVSYVSSCNGAGSRSALTPRRSAAMARPLVVGHANAYALTVPSSKPALPLLDMQFSFRQKGAVPRLVSSVVP